MALLADDGESALGCAVRQDGESGSVGIEYTASARDRSEPDADLVGAQVARVLSLDVDGAGFPALADRDPVVGDLIADHPGLRPVCFHSPYEAAAWAIIGNRISMARAATVKARLAEEHGREVTVEGARLCAFPGPETLRRLTEFPGLTDIKIERLRSLAQATLDGRLDAGTPRNQPADRALAGLRDLPGIGPFSAELILIRGAGHPDLFPTAEPRLHAAMAAAYGLDPNDTPRLARTAERWRPLRSWVSFLFRVGAQRR